MPVFDYRCSDCSATYDVYHKVREVKEDVVCPSCGSKNHRKLMSVPAVTVGSNSSSPEPSGSCDAAGGCCGGACGVN